MSDEAKVLKVVFYRSESGVEPVREWLLKMDREDRKIIGTDIKTVEFGWPIGMPVCRFLGEGVWEVRSNLTKGRISRVLFCIVDGNMVLVHGFLKKSRTTPKKDLDLARRRKRKLEVK